MDIPLLQRQAQAVGQQCRPGSGQDHGSQSSLSSDRGPGDITATSAGAPHPPSSCAEGRLRPGVPPKAVPSSAQKGRIQASFWKDSQERRRRANAEAWESPKVGSEPGLGATRRQEGKGAVIGSEREGQGSYQKSLGASSSCRMHSWLRGQRRTPPACDPVCSTHPFETALVKVTTA